MSHADGRPRVGFACAYTPLPLLHAAGCEPYRILPLGEAPDKAGEILHDNLCPHVKRVLDRKLAGDLPELAGVVFMNSCDAMRRLANAWESTEPRQSVTLVDLPVAGGDAAVAYLAGELRRLADVLGAWSGQPVRAAAIAESAKAYTRLTELLTRLSRRAAEGTLAGGRSTVQAWLNRAVTEPLEEVAAGLSAALTAPPDAPARFAPVPVMVIGNVLPDPEALAFVESCGARVVDDDLCTGKRQVTPFVVDAGADVWTQLARQTLARPACPRTLAPSTPGSFAEDAVERARASGASGVIAHVMKFCDPYLARLPALRVTFREADLPLLVLEGDCTLRSLGQQRTRVEAFVELLAC